MDGSDVVTLQLVALHWQDPAVVLHVVDVLSSLALDDKSSVDANVDCQMSCFHTLRNLCMSAPFAEVTADNHGVEAAMLTCRTLTPESCVTDIEFCCAVTVLAPRIPVTGTTGTTGTAFHLRWAFCGCRELWSAANDLLVMVVLVLKDTRADIVDKLGGVGAIPKILSFAGPLDDVFVGRARAVESSGQWTP